MVKRSYCTTREAAKILGISVRTAQLWCESSLLEAWKTQGGHRRISRNSVERLLADADLSALQKSEPLVRLDQNQLRILVVEDDPLQLQIYQEVLAKWPQKPIISTAANGFEGLVRLGQSHYHLMITDLMMPGMDGFEMLRTLITLPEFGSMKVVVVTAADDQEIERHRLHLPQSIPILKKPVNFMLLLDIAQKLTVPPDLAA